MSSKNDNEGTVRRSIALKLIRHAESMNNQVYRKARQIYHGGTPQFDLDGWNTYVDQHRSADPTISDHGLLQSNKLAQYLAPHLNNQASHPVRIITSPMLRTLQTLMPTLNKLQDMAQEEIATASGGEDVVIKPKVEIIVNALYHESEGCHIKDISEPGMNQHQITQLLNPISSITSKVSFLGFSDDPNDGWYAHGEKAETRSESETRASAFYLWLCEYLDAQLMESPSSSSSSSNLHHDCHSSATTNTTHHDVFDAGVCLPSEISEMEHDKISPRVRRRRTAVLIGHGDFMSLLLKRIVCGFGHSIENEGIPHRTAFVHFNTGITELEYFGKGRFLLMHTNDTPHLNHPNDISLRTGGSLKDGWSYLMPSDDIMLENEQVTVSFADELEDHVKDQMQALHNLFVPKRGSSFLQRKSSSLLRSSTSTSTSNLIVEEMKDVNHIELNLINSNSDSDKRVFVVKRGLQVVGCISFDEKTSLLSDLVVRPSATNENNIENALLDSVLMHASKEGHEKVFVMVGVESEAQKDFYTKRGFLEFSDGSDLVEHDTIMMVYHTITG